MMRWSRRIFVLVPGNWRRVDAGARCVNGATTSKSVMPPPATVRATVVSDSELAPFGRACMITILVLEHPPSARRTLCARLSIEPDMLVVGEAGDLASAVHLARELRPRIALIDAEMPGLDLCRSVKAIRSVVAVKVVVLTLHTASIGQAFPPTEATVVGKHEGVPALLIALRDTAGSGEL